MWMICIMNLCSSCIKKFIEWKEKKQQNWNLWGEIVVCSNKFEEDSTFSFVGNGRENIECDHAWHVKEGGGTPIGGNGI